MTHSLKRSLTLRSIGIMLASWLALAIMATVAVQTFLLREVDRVLDTVLLTAESVGGSFTGEMTPLQRIFDERMVPVESGFPSRSGERLVMRIRDAGEPRRQVVPSMNIWMGGALLLVGDETPVFDEPVTGTPERKAVNQLIEGDVWRVMYHYDGRADGWYAVGVRRQRALFDGAGLLLQMLLPLVVVIPLTVLALYYGVNRGLRPLQRLVFEIDRRRRNASLEPLDKGDAPLETRPVVEAMNHWLARLSDTLENEKRFTANAAHELQTPLAAISTEVQLCRRILDDPESLRMLDRIRARVERASHSVRQLLQLARLDPQTAIALETVDLQALLDEVLQEVAGTGLERGVSVRVRIPAGTALRANREAMYILLRNLVANALQYADADSVAELCFDEHVLSIRNDAPAVDDTDRLFDRFHRGHTSGDAAFGSGLGLSIARKISELHGFLLSVEYRRPERRFVVLLDTSGEVGHGLS